ncbi:putative pectate lyase P59 [Apium graveolens]|uniref:putative pectate lyase P59 n=1 Tax=Apium graveolens TaxID=4045 RepID=UPI003D7B5859
MEGTKLKYFLVVLACFAAVIPALNAQEHDDDDDVYWEKRSLIAYNHTLSAYQAHPHLVISHTNKAVQRMLGSANDTRRVLKGHRYRGPCMTTNPIDNCWRCNRKWADNRFRLADCGIGFGKPAIGGKGGPIYVVTDPSDDDMVNPKPGTLRHAVIQTGPLWIIFAHDMTIRLQQELIMQGDKTIDGRGARVHIAYGAGITIQFVNNVIIHGIRVHNIVKGSGGMIRDGLNHYGFRTESDGDGISIFGSTNIWIDHVSMSKCSDGLIDAIEGSTGITISNSHFTDHNDVMLLGASNGQVKDKFLQATVAFNHFGKRLIQRMPRVRFGFVHVVNNDYTHWNMYAIGGSQAPTIISQGNRFIAPTSDRLKEVTKRELAQESEWRSWNWRSEGDLMVNGAYFIESGDPATIDKFEREFNLVKAAKGIEVPMVTKFAGALDCVPGRKC